MSNKLADIDTTNSCQIIRPLFMYLKRFDATGRFEKFDIVDTHSDDPVVLQARIVAAVIFATYAAWLAARFSKDLRIIKLTNKSVVEAAKYAEDYMVAGIEATSASVGYAATYTATYAIMSANSVAEYYNVIDELMIAGLAFMNSVCTPKLTYAPCTEAEYTHLPSC